MSDALIFEWPVLIKAKPAADGRRVVEVEASNEEVDSEGDLVLQRALLDAAPAFVKTGNLDLDHISELGDRLGIPNPSSFIIGRPTEVKDLGKGRTAVVGEIMKSADGSHDPAKNRYDAFWDSLQADPPVRWRASIYGFPKAGMVEDCRETACQGGATRFVIKGLDWRSLAFTRNPINDAIRGCAHIVSAKAFISELIKGIGPQGSMGLSGMGTMGTYPGAVPVFASESGAPMYTNAVPRNMDELIGQHRRHIGKNCPNKGNFDSVAGFRDHFVKCCGAPPDDADVLSHALMYHLLLEKKRSQA